MCFVCTIPLLAVSGTLLRAHARCFTAGRKRCAVFVPVARRAAVTVAASAGQILPLPMEQMAVAGFQQLQEDGTGFLDDRGYHAPGAQRLHGHERPRGERDDGSASCLVVVCGE